MYFAQDILADVLGYDEIFICFLRKFRKIFLLMIHTNSHDFYLKFKEHLNECIFSENWVDEGHSSCLFSINWI